MQGSYPGFLIIKKRVKHAVEEFQCHTIVVNFFLLKPVNQLNRKMRFLQKLLKKATKRTKRQREESKKRENERKRQNMTHERDDRKDCLINIAQKVYRV